MAGGWGGRREGAGRPKGSTSTERPQSPKTESSEEPGRLADRAANGTFLPGHRFTVGNPGRPCRYSPVELGEKIREFVELRQDCERDPTWPGLAVFLGFSREAMRRYRNGDYGKSAEEKLAYVEMCEIFDQFMEDEAETELSRKTGQTAGIVHRLNNRFSADWQQKVEHAVAQELNVTIDLTRADELSPPIEPQAIQGEKHGE